MRVLIADKLDDSAIAGIKDLGCGVTVDPGLSDETLTAAIERENPDVLVVRSTKVQAPQIAAADSLNLIIRAGAGYDNVDIDAASGRSIFVANCPGMNAIAVAELAWALILCCDRRVPDQVAELRERKWNKKEYSKDASGLAGHTLGIIGVGNIGAEMIKRGRAFGMNVICYSPSLTIEKAERIGVESPSQVAFRKF